MINNTAERDTTYYDIFITKASLFLYSYNNIILCFLYSIYS